MSSSPLPVRNNRNKNNGKKKWYRSPKLWRHGTMLFFFLLIAHIAHKHLEVGGGPKGEPPIDAYCPFGGLENLYQFITTGGFIRRLEPSTMIIFVIVVLLTLVFSRGFCGWICPFGAIQEWIGLLGKKVLGKKYNPTGSWDRSLRYLKYVVLAVIIALTWWTGTLIFHDYDPFVAFFHFGEGIDEKPWAYGILFAVLIGSFFIDRFFCKYACPLGAVLGILGKFGLTRIHRETAGCNSCNICQQKCPAHIDFLSVTDIRTAECNHCLDCVVDCPIPGIITARVFKWKFSHPVYAALLVAGLFGLIGISKATATWQTKPAEIRVTDNAGNLDPDAIRGWMTLADISREFGIPLDRLYTDSGLPRKVGSDVQIKEIHNKYEVDFEPELIREVVRARLAGAPPPDLTEYRRTTPSVRHERRQTTGERPGQSSGPPAGEGRGRGQGPGSAGSDNQNRTPSPVRGNTTLNEITLKTGVPIDYILKTAGLPEDVPRQQPLRDWIHDYNKTPRDLRDAIDKYRAEHR